MIRIAVVTKNQIVFDRIEEFAAPLLYKPYDKTLFTGLNVALNTYIWSVLEPYVTFVDIDPVVAEAPRELLSVDPVVAEAPRELPSVDPSKTDIIELVCGLVTKCFKHKQLDNFFYKTEGSYAFPSKSLELFYAEPTWASYKPAEQSNMNNIGCLMSLKHTVIENNCVIFANSYDLSNKKEFVKKGLVTKEDIIKVIRRRFFHTAVLIKNNTFIKYYYQNPIYLMSKIFDLNVETDSVQTISFAFLNYNLTYCSKGDSSANTNEIATRICAHNKICGDVLVLHEQEEKVFTNISIKEIQQLDLLAYGKLSDRDVQSDENYTLTGAEGETDTNADTDTDTNTDTNTATDSNPIRISLWSKHLVRLNRLNKLKSKPNACLKCQIEITNPVVCVHCFRAKYCSMDCCVGDFRQEHFKECIY